MWNFDSRKFFAGVCIVVVGLAQPGCKKQASPPPPPPNVTVALPIQKTVIDYAYFTGRTEALKAVDLRARVQGFLKSVNFEDGAVVEEGKLLFEIDPAPFQAALDQAKAELQHNVAAYNDALFNYQRNKEAYEKKVSTSMELMTAKAARDKTAAAVSAAKANVEKAEINLGYCKIFAPVSGKMSRHFVDIGNLVGYGEPTLLANIVTLKPIYVYFNISERGLLKYRADVEERRAELTQQGKEISVSNLRPVWMQLSNETDYPHKGYLDYLSNQVDPSTGTIQARGVWPNEDGTILAGMFSRVRIPINDEDDAMLVTEKALGRSQFGPFLLTVNDKNIVEQHIVEIGPLVDGMRVIKKGIKMTDRVVVDGLQSARPGSTVNPQQEAAPKKPAVQTADNKAATTQAAKK